MDATTIARRPNKFVYKYEGQSLLSVQGGPTPEVGNRVSVSDDPTEYYISDLAMNGDDCNVLLKVAGVEGTTLSKVSNLVRDLQVDSVIKSFPCIYETRSHTLRVSVGDSCLVKFEIGDKKFAMKVEEVVAMSKYFQDMLKPPSASNVPFNPLAHENMK